MPKQIISRRELNAIIDARKQECVSFNITDAKALKFLRAASSWQEQTPSAYLKEIVTNLLRGQHADVENAFEGNFGNE